MGAVKLIGALVGFTILAGLGYAGIRITMRKWGIAHDEEMVTLHLGWGCPLTLASFLRRTRCLSIDGAA